MESMWLHLDLKYRHHALRRWCWRRRRQYASIKIKTKPIIACIRVWKWYGIFSIKDDWHSVSNWWLCLHEQYTLLVLVDDVTHWCFSLKLSQKMAKTFNTEHAYTSEYIIHAKKFYSKGISPPPHFNQLNLSEMLFRKVSNFAFLFISEITCRFYFINGKWLMFMIST